MRIIRQQAVQVHAVPNRVTSPKGPFPPELTVGHPLAEPELVINPDSAYAEDGSQFPLGATVQNNYEPEEYLTCAICLEEVLESQTQNHICED